MNNIKTFFNKIIHFFKKIKPVYLKLIIFAILSSIILISILVSVFKYKMPKNNVDIPKLSFEKGELFDYKKYNKSDRNNYKVIDKGLNSLSIDLDTTNVIVNKDGSLYETIPFNRLGSKITDPQKSPFIIEYYYKGNPSLTALDTYSQSINVEKRDGTIFRDYEIYKLKDGVRVVYNVEKRIPEISWFPSVIYNDEFNNKLEELSSINIVNEQLGPLKTQFYKNLSNINIFTEFYSKMTNPIFKNLLQELNIKEKIESDFRKYDLTQIFIDEYIKKSSTMTFNNILKSINYKQAFENLLNKYNIKAVFNTKIEQNDIKYKYQPELLIQTKLDKIFENIDLYPQITNLINKKDIEDISNKLNTKINDIRRYNKYYNVFKNSYKMDTDLDYVSIFPTIDQNNLYDLYDLWYKKYNLTREELIQRSKQILSIPTFINFPSFKIPIDYRLDEKGNLVVEVLNDKIEENSPDIGERTIKLKSIKLFPYMLSIIGDNSGDSLKFNKNDFIFVPDGSGAIIKPYYLNQLATQYFRFYSNDELFNSYQVKVKDDIKSILPIYGYADNKGSILSSIEGSVSSSAMYLTPIGNIYQSYTIFDLRFDDNYEFVKGTKIRSYEDLNRDERIKVKYMFIKKEPSRDITYYDMVNTVKENYLSNLVKKDNYSPIEIEILGAILDKKHFIGIPYYSTKALTKYRDVEKIINTFDNLKIEYKYSGFSKGGLRGYSQDNLKHDSSLGTYSDLKYLQDKYPNIYYDIYLRTYYYNNDSNFKNSRSGLNTIGGNIQTYYERSDKTLLQDINDLTKYYILNPNYIYNKATNVLENIKDYRNISLRDIGNLHYANYTYDKMSADNVSHIIDEVFKQYKKEHKIMLNSPFIRYAILANSIEDIPTKSSQNINYYSDIPFLQLLYSNYSNVFSNAVNLNNKEKSDIYLMKALMSGNGLKYILSYNDSQITKQIPYYNKYYATNYKNYIDKIKKEYKILNDFNVENKSIIDHNIIDKGIYIVTYENMSKYIYNFSNKNYKYNSIDINSNTYKKVE